MDDSLGPSGTAMDVSSRGENPSDPIIDGTGGNADISGIGSAAKELAGQATVQAQEKIEEAKEKIASAAEPLKDDARAFAEKGKRRGASRISHLAKAIHSAADEMGKEVPQAARYIHAGAARLDDASDMLRNKSLDQLLTGANRAAHDRPLTFFAGSVAAGFLFARFLRSSSQAGAR